MVEILCNNWLDILLVLVGTSAIVVYILQKQSERKAAATKVLLQIDQIEKSVTALKSTRPIDNIAVYKAPVLLEHNSWEECGYQFYKHLQRDDIRLIDDFFVCAAELEKSRVAICRSLSVAWEHKDAELQKRIAEIVRNSENISEDIDSFKQSFNPCAELFTADIPIDILLINLKNYRTLSGTTAYKRLQRLSYRK